MSRGSSSYAEDAAEGILLAVEHYNQPNPVNLGSGEEIRIRDLVCLIQQLSGFEGEIAWDGSRPDGQPQRSLDTTRAEREFGFKAKTHLREGLAKTIRWCESVVANRTVKAGT